MLFRSRAAELHQDSSDRNILNGTTLDIESLRLEALLCGLEDVGQELCERDGTMSYTVAASSG